MVQAGIISLSIIYNPILQAVVGGGMTVVKWHYWGESPFGNELMMHSGSFSMIKN